MWGKKYSYFNTNDHINRLPSIPNKQGTTQRSPLGFKHWSDLVLAEESMA